MKLLSYSFHISSKNHSINTKVDLKNVSDHNTRKYKEVKENNLEMNLELSFHNEIIRGTDNCYKDVKDFYQEYFEESRVEFNQKQKRDDRKIYDYFEKISEDSKKQLAVEIIVQLGDKKFWENKTIEEKKQMTNVFKEQLNFLEKQLSDFKICNAIIHYDEASPHIQLVGVPVAENFKQGMKKQVSKKAVFTRETLRELQEKMRENAIENFNKFYKTKEVLKPLEKGRNKDYLIEEIKEIERLKREKKEKEKRIADLKNELKSLNNFTQKLNNEKFGLERKKTDLEREIKTGRNELRASELAISELSQKKLELGKVKENLEQKNKELINLRTDFDDIQSTVNLMFKEVKKLRSEKLELEEEKKELKIDIKYEEEEILRLENKLEKLEDISENLEEKTIEKQRKIEILKSDIENKDTIIEDYKNTIKAGLETFKDEFWTVKTPGLIPKKTDKFNPNNLEELRKMLFAKEILNSYSPEVLATLPSFSIRKKIAIERVERIVENTLENLGKTIGSNPWATKKKGFGLGD